MSRGLGKVQAKILGVLERDGIALLPEISGHSQPSLSRAARSLERRGLVRVWILETDRLRRMPDQARRFMASVACAFVTPADVDTKAKALQLRDEMEATRGE